MGNLILVRHGQSLWNLENRFTGWTNVDLSAQGIEEAQRVGQLFKENHIDLDICFSSYLKRAIRTQWTILENADQMHVDCLYHWKLNERHYGDWQGLDKDEVLRDFGEENYWAIRRGFDVPPPPLSLEDKRHPQYDSNYKNLEAHLLPSTESLKDTQLRVVNYFYEAIVPQLSLDKTVLVTAHGNSLRALIANLGHIAENDVPHIDVPTGTPFLYEFDGMLNLMSHQKLS